MKILIIRNDRIGDLISSSLIVPMLRHVFGKKLTKIDLICSNYGFNYAAKVKSDFSNIFINERSLSPLNDLKLLKEIRKKSYDISITLSPNNKSFFLNILSNSKLKASIRLIKKKLDSKPSKFLSKHIDIFMDIENDKNYHKLAWSDFYSKLCKDIYKSALKKEFRSKATFPSNYLKPKINYTLHKKKISNFIIFHIDEKWSESKIKIKFLASIILNISKIKKVLITTNFDKTKYNNKLNKILGFKYTYKIINESTISNKLFLLNKIKRDKSTTYLDKLIQCISLSKCVIQVHGGIGHYAGSLNRNIINLKIKNENLQKLYKIQTEGSYADLYLNNSQKLKKSITNIVKKIN